MSKTRKAMKNRMRETLNAVLNERPYIRDYIYHLLDVEKLNPAGSISEYSPSGAGWEADDTEVPLEDITYMLRKGIIIKFWYSHSSKYYCVNPTVVEILKEIEMMEQEITQKKNISVDIPDDLFDIVVGYEDFKRILKMIIKSDKQVHALMIGPPASGKTVFLYELSRLYGSRIIDGGSTSAAGIFDILLDEDIGILVIDEIDKMSPDHQGALCQFMETGVVRKDKFGMHQSKQVNTKVIAACNRDNKLIPELLSRFMRVKFKPYTPEEFKEVTVGVLVKRENKSEELANYIADKCSENGFIDVRDAVRIARLADSKEEVDMIVSVMNNYR